jgi:hypothetical protein
MTDSDMPLASATPPVASPSPQVSTRASTRARARIAAVASDVRRWWLLITRPPSLKDWTKSTKPSATVPDSPLLRLLWVATVWMLGLPMRVVSMFFFLVGAALAWASTHPLRTWAFVLMVAALVSYWLLGR